MKKRANCIERYMEYLNSNNHGITPTEEEIDRIVKRWRHIVDKSDNAENSVGGDICVDYDTEEMADEWDNMLSGSDDITMDDSVLNQDEIDSLLDYQDDVENSVGGVTEKFHSGGGNSDYYKVIISKPVDGSCAYQAECLDIIMALQMDFAEGEAFKAIWRKAASRQGNGKPGNSALYNAEKIAFFGKIMVESLKDE